MQLDEQILSVDSEKNDSNAYIEIKNVRAIGNNGLYSAWIMLHDNKHAVNSSSMPVDIEGDLVLLGGEGIFLLDANQIGGDGSFSDYTVGDNWIKFSNFWARGDMNAFRLDFFLAPGSGPFVLDAIFAAEGAQPHGYEPENTAYRTRDSYGFFISNGKIVPAFDGDAAIIEADEALVQNSEIIPAFYTTLESADGFPVEAEYYRCDEMNNVKWDACELDWGEIWPGYVNLDLCFWAFPTWYAEGTGVQGDNRPEVLDPLSFWCNDGDPNTICNVEPMPLQEMRIYMYEESTNVTEQIPDDAFGGPLYTDNNGCVNVTFNWIDVKDGIYGTWNGGTDNFPDLIAYTYYEGGHPDVNSATPTTEEPIFEVGAYFSNDVTPNPMDYYTSYVAATTNVMDNVGSSDGYFGGSNGAELFYLNEEWDNANPEPNLTDMNLNARSNIYIMTNRVLDIAYQNGVVQAFYCTTEFIMPPNGPPEVPPCDEDRLHIIYDRTGWLGSHYSDGKPGPMNGPQIIIDDDAGFKTQTVGHEMGHFIHHMAYHRESFSQTYSSTIETESEYFSGYPNFTSFDCSDNTSHSDWCLEYQSSATCESWADFWGVASWFDPDAIEPIAGNTSTYSAYGYFYRYAYRKRIDQWPDYYNQLADCNNPLDLVWEGTVDEVEGSHALNLEGLVRQIWWDLYDEDQPLDYSTLETGDYESLNQYDNAMQYVDAYKSDGTPFQYSVPRENITLELYQMVDAWEEVYNSNYYPSETYFNGSYEEKAMLRDQNYSLHTEKIPDEWIDWRSSYPTDSWIEKDPDAPNLYDWYDGFLEVTNWDDETHRTTSSFLNGGGCLWTQNRQ